MLVLLISIIYPIALVSLILVGHRVGFVSSGGEVFVLAFMVYLLLIGLQTVVDKRHKTETLSILLRAGISAFLIGCVTGVVVAVMTTPQAFSNGLSYRSIVYLSVWGAGLAMLGVALAATVLFLLRE